MRTRYIVLQNRRGSHCVIDMVKVRMKRMRVRVFTWTRVLSDIMGPGSKMAMYTLTYDTLGTLGEAHVWQAGDIGDFIRRLKMRMGDRIKAYAWVAELQRNGNIHYHVLLVYKGWLAYPDKEYRQEGKRGLVKLWDKGMARTELKVRSPFYIAAYVGKEYQKDFENFPKGAHAWAVWFSDSALKEALRFYSLDDLAQGLVTAFGWHVGLSEYPSVKSDLDKEGWRFVSACISKEFAEFLATDDLEMSGLLA